MGCGSSTASSVDEPLKGVLPDGGAAATPTGSGGADPLAQAGTDSEGKGASKPIKRKLVIYDPLTAEFPPSSASLARPMPGRDRILQIEPEPEWKRIGEVLAALKSPVDKPAPEEEEEEKKEPDAASDTSAAGGVSVFSSALHEDNVVAGPFADPHVVAALASLAAFPNRLMRLFPVMDEGTQADDEQKQNPLDGMATGSKCKSTSMARMALSESASKFASSIAEGRFELRLFYGGRWQRITVDDTVPVGGAPLQPLFTSSRDRSEYWMMLLEKALAQVTGSYEDCFFQTPVELFRLLTGGSGEVIPIPAQCSKAEQDGLWAQLKECWDRNDLLTCHTRVMEAVQQQAALVSRKAPKSDREAVAAEILQDHAELGVDASYSLLAVEELPAAAGGHRLVLLRNPIGSQQWEGRWSDDSEQWAELEAQPEGGLLAAQLRVIKKKHQMPQRGDPTGNSGNSGLFWISFGDLVRHFQAIFVCRVLADSFDHCQTQQGKWEGRSAAGRPADMAGPNSTKEGGWGNWLNNPCFRIRNTAAKKSSTVVLTLSKGVGMRNEANAAAQDAESYQPPTPVWMGFRVVSNQLNHTLNCNPPVPSPLFGQLQVSPLCDELVTSKLSSETSVSVTIPHLDPYTDYYVVPYLSDSGMEGDFVLNLWSNSTTILFDACAPHSPIELPVSWSKAAGTAPGNLWTEHYLSNPQFKLTNQGEEPVNLLINLLKTSSKHADLNCNLSVMTNIAPHPLNCTAVGTVSAPVKATAVGKRAVTAAGGAGDASSGGPEKKKIKALSPVTGVLSPWFEVLEGGTTRTAPDNFYSVGRSYPLVTGPFLPGQEYFLVPSLFTGGVSGSALLQVYAGAASEQIKLEPVAKESARAIHSRWAGINAAGPARRKKTYLNNPQFCFRHQHSAPISIVFSLTLAANDAAGASVAELPMNLTLATFPSGTADPNPFTQEEKEGEKKRAKDAAKQKQKEAEAKRKQEEKNRAAQNPMQGVASLRIKSKGGASKKKKSNMFGEIAWEGEAGADTSAASDSAQPRLTPLSTDFELVSQSTFSGDLYKSARQIHLFVSGVQPNKSYFLLPSTSVPGQESEFEVACYARTGDVDVRFEPCTLNAVADATVADLAGLASRRVSGVPAGLASQRVKKLVQDDDAPTKKSKKKKKEARR